MTTTAKADTLGRDASALLGEYQAGAWEPLPEEHDLADGLARVHWTAHSLRAGLRDLPAAVREGRLVSVLDPAIQVLESRDAIGVDDAVLRLRVLIDALAAAP